MFAPRQILGIFLYVNLLSWVLLLGIKGLLWYLVKGQPDFGGDFYLRGLLLNLFFLLVFFFFHTRTEQRREPNFTEALLNTFFFGGVSLCASVLLYGILLWVEGLPRFPYQIKIIDSLYHLNLGITIVFLTAAFFDWKALILYQRTIHLVRLWQGFEYVLLLSLLFDFFKFDLSDLPFQIALGVLLCLGLFLSVNLKWVAYLNAREKWQSILLISLTTGVIYYFFVTVIRHNYNPHFSTNLMQSVYVLALLIFVLFYAVFSLLVILFHLPTGAVYAQKIEEIVSFQRLAHSLQSGDDEQHVYEALLDSAINTVDADAAWLEIYNEKGEVATILPREVELSRVLEMRVLMLRHSREHQLGRKSPATTILADFGFPSAISAALNVNDKDLGYLTLLKRVPAGFGSEKQQLIQTFARQAGLSIENLRLLTKTLEAERYREELKIAQRIQKSLLPNQLNVAEGFEIEAFSESAYEVGGDYYDVYRSPQGKVIVVVADVAGKGANAALYMAQMKGIFQTLTQLDLDAETFLEHANLAISQCLARNSFITLTLVIIHPRTREVEIARAGHCPTLYYNAKAKGGIYFQGNGLGLGILRKGNYREHLETQFFSCGSGDIILLYTDGIVETTNAEGEEYGYDRLQDLVEQYASLRSIEILGQLLVDLRKFRPQSRLQDDNTALVIKCV